MRVCVFLSPIEMEYPRHRGIIGGLEQAGVEVETIVLPSWIGLLECIERPFHAGWVATKEILKILPELGKIASCDFIFVPAFKSFLIPYLALIARLLRKPIMVDYMVGLCDVNEDRQLQQSPFKKRLLARLDKWIIENVHTVTDTQEHRAYFAEHLGADMGKMNILPINVRDELMTLPYPSFAPGKPRLVVQYIGEYIPFHGVSVIIEAAKLLEPCVDIRFELIGRGQEYEQIEQQVEALHLSNVRLIHGYFPLEDYMRLVLNGDVHLGVFKTSSKLSYVVPNKVVEGMAAGRVVITGQSAAVNTNFVAGTDILVVPTDDPQALAVAIQRLYDDPNRRREIAHAGRSKIEQGYVPRMVGKRLLMMMQEIMASV